jgi:hypothetical protein
MKNNSSNCNILSTVFLIAIVLIVLVFILLCIRMSRVENFENYAPSPMMDNAEDPVEMANAVENFIRYPGLQMFCTVMKGNLANFWAKLPESVADGHYVKLCCSSCHGIISESLCQGEEGKYQVSRMTEDDITNIKTYYRENNLDFGLDETTLDEQFNQMVLKLRHNNIMYPVQVLKLKENLDVDEDINDDLTHTC